LGRFLSATFASCKPLDSQVLRHKPVRHPSWGPRRSPTVGAVATALSLPFTPLPFRGALQKNLAELCVVGVTCLRPFIGRVELVHLLCSPLIHEPAEPVAFAVEMPWKTRANTPGKGTSPTGSCIRRLVFIFADQNSPFQETEKRPR